MGFSGKNRRKRNIRGGLKREGVEKVKWLRFLVIPIALVLILGGFVLAQTLLKSTPVMVAIVAGETSVEVYSDPELTAIVTALDFGEMQKGSSNLTEFYVANTGDEDINIDFELDTDISLWGIVTFYPGGRPVFIQPDNYAACAIQIEVSPTASIGTQNFNLRINNLP